MKRPNAYAFSCGAVERIKGATRVFALVRWRPDFCCFTLSDGSCIGDCYLHRAFVRTAQWSPVA